MMNKRGFTLLEILVSVGILSTIAIVVAQSFFTVLRSNTKTEILKDVKQSGETAMLTMARMIQNAQEVTSICAPEGTTLESIDIVNPDGGTTSFGCFLDGTTTRIASTSGSTDFLTDNRVTIGGDACSASSLVFVCTSTAGLPARVSVSFSLAQSGVSAQEFESASETYTATVSIRNDRP
jgi:prepilin-type N-terminal cleavage/methylation domain-containing protein